MSEFKRNVFFNLLQRAINAAQGGNPWPTDRLLAEIGEASAAGRIVLAKNEPGKPGKSSIISRWDQNLPHSTRTAEGNLYPEIWIESFKRGQEIYRVRHSIVTREEDDWLSKQKANALLFVPVLVGEEWGATLEFYFVDIPGEWLLHDMAYLQCLSQLLGNSLEYGKPESVAATLKQHDYLFSMLPDAILVTDKTGRILLSNSQAEEMFLYGRHDLMEQPIEVLVPDALRDRHAKQRASFMEHPHSRPMGTRLQLQGRKKDGTIFPVDISLSPLPVNGDVLVIAAVRDLTDLRQVETALREKEERFRALIENSLDAVMIVDSQGTIIYHSPASQRILGYTNQEVVNLNVFEFTHPDIVSEFQGHLAALLVHPQSPSSYEALVRHKDGSWRWIEAVATNLIEIPSIGGIVVNYRDITERKEMTENLERRLRESQVMSDLSRALNETLNLKEIFRMIVESVLVLLPNADSAVIHLLDEKNQVLRMEARAGNNIQRASEMETSMPIDRGLAAWVFSHRTTIKRGNVRAEPLYLPGKSDILSIIVAPVQSQENIYGTLSVNSHELDAFSERDEELIGTLARNASIAIANAGLYQELGEKYQELQRIQTRLVQSEKLVSLGQLLSGIAHELNNPLTTILLSTQMLRQRIPLNLEEEAIQLEKESFRAVNIVRSLLDYVRQKPIRRDPLDVVAVLDESVKLTKSQLDLHNVILKTDYPKALSLVIGDPYRLQQVFINVINNACQAMAEQKRSRVLKIRIEEGESRLETEKQDIFTRIIFQDTGPGISPETLPFLFEPFFTTKTDGKGTGLGLPIAHGIVIQHEGHIWVESLPGEGARFYVEIPIVKEEKINESLPHPASKPSTGTLRSGNILIIDDEVALTAVLKMALERKGYTVDVAHHIEAALGKTGNKIPSLILCDMHLQGITGMDFYSKLREAMPDVPVIFMTGDSLDNHVRNFIENTQAPYLIKPFELVELTDKINEVFSNKGS